MAEQQKTTSKAASKATGAKNGKSATKASSAKGATSAAQQGQRDRYFANQQEAGRQLLGQSTYVAPDGAALALPHTWQRNSTHVHQGQTYRVDASGQYHVLGANGWWCPLQPR